MYKFSGIITDIEELKESDEKSTSTWASFSITVENEKSSAVFKFLGFKKNADNILSDYHKMRMNIYIDINFTPKISKYKGRNYNNLNVINYNLGGHYKDESADPKYLHPSLKVTDLAYEDDLPF